MFCRLKVHYIVGDSSGSVSVVFWDRLARQLLNKTAAELKEGFARVCFCIDFLFNYE